MAAEALSVVSNVAGVLAGLGAVGAVLLATWKFVRSIKSESDFKAKAPVTSINDLKAEFGDMSSWANLTEARMQDLKVKLVDLVSATDMRESDKEEILSGLRQSSDVSNSRYAQKLYTMVGGAGT
jgi:hypothetical protein